LPFAVPTDAPAAAVVELLEELLAAGWVLGVLELLLLLPHPATNSAALMRAEAALKRILDLVMILLLLCGFVGPIEFSRSLTEDANDAGILPRRPPTMASALAFQAIARRCVRWADRRRVQGCRAGERPKSSD
jgi:hypothetical protein